MTLRIAFQMIACVVSDEQEKFKSSVPRGKVTGLIRCVKREYQTLWSAEWLSFGLQTVQDWTDWTDRLTD